MGVIKVIGKVAIVGLAIVGACCIKPLIQNRELPVVGRSAYEASRNETQAARKDLQSVQEKYVRQNEELSKILSEVAELSGQTAVLRLDCENNMLDRTQAEEIDDNLDAIRGRIDRLEKEIDAKDSQNKANLKTIKNLRRTVDSQRKEIKRLVGVIAEQDATIRIQSDTISEQNKEIVRQKAALEVALKNLTASIYEAARNLENLGDECDAVLTVNGRKDKEKVATFKKILYTRASDLYEKAAEQNHPSALIHLQNINTKLNSL